MWGGVLPRQHPPSHRPTTASRHRGSTAVAGDRTRSLSSRRIAQSPEALRRNEPQKDTKHPYANIGPHHALVLQHKTAIMTTSDLALPDTICMNSSVSHAHPPRSPTTRTSAAGEQTQTFSSVWAKAPQWERDPCLLPRKVTFERRLRALAKPHRPLPKSAPFNITLAFARDTFSLRPAPPIAIAANDQLIFPKQWLSSDGAPKLPAATSSGKRAAIGGPDKGV